MTESVLARALAAAESTHRTALVRNVIASVDRRLTLAELRDIFEEKGLQRQLYDLTIADVHRVLAPTPAEKPVYLPRFPVAEEPAPKKSVPPTRSRVEREEIEAKVLSILAGYESAARRADVARALGLPEPDVAAALRALTKSGYVRRSGAGATGNYSVAAATA